MFIIHETYTNGYRTDILDIISLLAILCGILVIISKNPIVSVLFLIGLFASISCYLIMLGLSFIGLSYQNCSILFLFILMLINIRISELQSNTSNSILLAIAIAISFNYPVFQLLPYNITILNNYYNLNHILQNIYLNLNNKKINLNLYNDDIYFVTSKIWDGNLIENSHITSIGNILYTSYNVWLILASFILLLAMVGAIVITIKPNTSNN
uniref:NADH-ubiquinone oxidoreductase chain 6 n=1 Tax=Nemania diffusa TaxID=389665 RepID=A0A6M8NV93_9PEZI|nr:NADH dehydrogenase subunit 6 [Nemania diffusa]QKG05016.1 NADH dehydrogenase subunit 6 [Nemania diffusa]